MQQNGDTNLVVRRNRTPRTQESKDGPVRESLLSDSTSGIVKGEEDDTTSVGTNSFSSPDIEFSAKEHLLTISNNNTQSKSETEEELKLLKSNNGNDPIKITKNYMNDVEKADLEKADLDKDDKVSIPDGGWGWIVVLSSFVISMIADGISFSFGLLYIELVNEFKASKSTTAWIGSLFIAVPLLSGPVMSALVDRYGCRSMTILGGIISTLGFILASMSTSLEMMMITFGVIAGLGLGLVYVTAVVSIAFWFEKKRNLAVGLGACGTGVGTFIYAPLTSYCLERYGWRGTILILSGTLLNLCVCGCVMRDPEWRIIEQKKQNSKNQGRLIKQYNDELGEKSKNSSSASVSNPCAMDFNSPSRGKVMDGLIKRGVSPQRVIDQEAASIRRHQKLLVSVKDDKLKQRSQSMANLPSSMEQNDKVSQAILESLIKSTSKDSNKEVIYPKLNITTEDEMKNCGYDKDNADFSKTEHDFQRSNSERCEVKTNKDIIEVDAEIKKVKPNVAFRKCKSESKEDKELVKQDSKENKRDWLKKQLSVNHHYLKDLKMPLNSISHRNAMLNIKKYRLKVSSCPDIFKNSMITIDEKEQNWYDDCLACFSDMFNVSLFKKMTFNCLCLGTILLFIWFIVPYFYLAEFMIDNGYDIVEGSFMLSLIGITNTIGMVVLGWIGDFPSVSIGNLYAACLVLCGASVAAMPPSASIYWCLATVCAVFGLSFAASFTFTPSLLVTLVSLDDFTSAYGLVLLAQGIGHLIGPPLSGMVYDLTKSWDLPFYLAGGWIVVAGGLISFIQPIRNYQQRRRDAAVLDF